MNITKENDELVLRITLWQDSYDALGDKQGRAPTLMGVIAGNEYTISYLIDLGYKGDQQEGIPVIHCADKEELLEICKIFDLDIIEHENCQECKEVIYGTYTYGTNGVKCMSCDYKSNK